jgi:hypothetical protein
MVRRRPCEQVATPGRSNCGQRACPYPSRRRQPRTTGAPPPRGPRTQGVPYRLRLAVGYKGQPPSVEATQTRAQGMSARGHSQGAQDRPGVGLSRAETTSWIVTIAGGTNGVRPELPLWEYFHLASGRAILPRT